MSPHSTRATAPVPRPARPGPGRPPRQRAGAVDVGVDQRLDRGCRRRSGTGAPGRRSGWSPGPRRRGRRRSPGRRPSCRRRGRRPAGRRRRARTARPGGPPAPWWRRATRSGDDGPPITGPRPPPSATAWPAPGRPAFRPWPRPRRAARRPGGRSARDGPSPVGVDRAAQLAGCPRWSVEQQLGGEVAQRDHDRRVDERRSAPRGRGGRPRSPSGAGLRFSGGRHLTTLAM
jgi:hypothetical protein